ncbi:7128_t:CDS:2, partial [Cetraspora pellucida]
HLDDTELYHFKLVLDEIFGKENFVANVVWQKNYSPKGLSKFISFSHDNILIFAKDKEKLDFNREFTIGEITKNRYEITTPSGKAISPPTQGRSWRMIGHNDKAKREIRKLFPEIEPFQTPKPERLLQRIIQIATNEDDIVLDYFAGSGTTAAVAQKLKRKWVIVENNEDTVNIFTAPRLKKVISGEDKGGISEEVRDVLLAVVDGMLTEGLVNFLLNSMDEDKFLEIATLAVDPDLENKNYNNVKIGKIPVNILRHYARFLNWWLTAPLSPYLIHASHPEFKEKQKEEKMTLSYRIYYFDLTASASFLTPEGKKDLRLNKVKFSSCEFYYGKLEESNSREYFIMESERKPKEEHQEEEKVIYYGLNQNISHPLDKLGSGYLKIEILRSLVESLVNEQQLQEGERYLNKKGK